MATKKFEIQNLEDANNLAQAIRDQNEQVAQLGGRRIDQVIITNRKQTELVILPPLSPSIRALTQITQWLIMEN